MPEFSKNIDGHNFTFTRIYTVKGVKYHVSVHNYSEAYYFIMDLNEKWVISDVTKLPPWIKLLEGQFHEAISNHIK